jgi:hypothetical protein
LAAVAARLGPADAAKAADTLALALTKTTDPVALTALGVILREMLTSPRPAERLTRCGTVGVAVGSLASLGFPLAIPGTLPLALQPLPCRFSTPELVEMLKRPLCIGRARRVILDQLENHHRRTFADHWEFVRFAQEQNLGLDFTTSPKR